MSMKPEEVDQLKIAVNQFYLSKYLDLPKMSDFNYDSLVSEFESEFGTSVKSLIEWDDQMKFENRNPVSLSKTAVQDNDLIGAVRDYIKSQGYGFDDYYVLAKYDGCSIKAEYDNGKLVRILGTPDERFGILRTKAFWNKFPHYVDPSISSLIGEVLVDYRPYGQLARNKANGLTNSKLMDGEVDKLAQVRIYIVNYHDTTEYDYGRQMDSLWNLLNEDTEGHFKVAYPWKGTEFESENFTPLFDFPNGDHFQLDGLVVYGRNGIHGFKFYFTESQITKVENISWSQLPNGSFAPTLEITPIVLNDKNIGRISANGVPTMINSEIGVGSEIEAILVNMTIPKVHNVISPSNDFRYPTCKCGYQLSENDIYGATLKCGNEGLCSDKYNKWKTSLSEKLTYDIGCGTYSSEWNHFQLNFFWWMDQLKIDRWNPRDKFKWSEFTESDIVTSIYLSILNNDFEKFNLIISQSFSFSDLQRKNLDINIRSAFEAFRDSLLEKE